jgi:hypothetical protein
MSATAGSARAVKGAAANAKANAVAGQNDCVHISCRSLEDNRLVRCGADQQTPAFAVSQLARYRAIVKEAGLI